MPNPALDLRTVKVKFRREFLCLVSFVAVALMMLGCRQKSGAEDWHAGGPYSMREDHGQFSVARILVLEPEAVHVRIYKQRFSARPTSVDPASLTLGAYDDKEGFSIGHVPLSRRTFALSDPVFMSQQSVSDKELEGYKMWKESSGKTF